MNNNIIDFGEYIRQGEPHQKKVSLFVIMAVVTVGGR